MLSVSSAGLTEISNAHRACRELFQKPPIDNLEGIKKMEVALAKIKSRINGVDYFTFEPHHKSSTLRVKSEKGVFALLTACQDPMADAVAALAFKQARFSGAAFKLLMDASAEMHCIKSIEFINCDLSARQCTILDKPTVRKKLITNISFANDRSINDWNVLDHLWGMEVEKLYLDNTAVVDGNTIVRIIKQSNAMRAISLCGCWLEAEGLCQALAHLTKTPSTRPLKLCFSGNEPCFTDDALIEAVYSCVKSGRIECQCEKDSTLDRRSEELVDREYAELVEKIEATAIITQGLLDQVFSYRSDATYYILEDCFKALLEKSGFLFYPLESDEVLSLFESVALLNPNLKVTNSTLKTYLARYLTYTEDLSSGLDEKNEALILKHLAGLLRCPIVVFTPKHPCTVLNGKPQPHCSMLFTPKDIDYPTIHLFKGYVNDRVNYTPLYERNSLST